MARKVGYNSEISCRFLPGTYNTPDGILWSPLLSQKKVENLAKATSISLYFCPFQKAKTKTIGQTLVHMSETEHHPKEKQTRVCTRLQLSY